VKPVFRILLWTGLVVLVVLGVTEGILWLTAPVPKSVGYTVDLDNEIPGVKAKVSFDINERFLRTWRSGEQGGRTVRVVCLGGSATAAPLQNNKDAWWAQLGAMLEQQFPDARFEVSALMREGLGVLYGAKWAQEHLAATQCDILIAVYGLDDILLHPDNYTYQAAKLDSVKLGGRDRGPVRQFLINTSQICRRISNGRQRRALAQNLGRWRERNFYAKGLARERAVYAQLPIRYEIGRTKGRDPVVEYVDGLKSLAASAKANNALFLAVGEPTLHSGVMGPEEELLVHRWFTADPSALPKGVFRLDSGRIDIELGRYFSEAEKACQALGVPFYNPQRKVTRTSIHFVDDVHVTDEGAAGFAHLLLPLVKPLVETRLKK
jgi:hypothetical protein